MDGVTEPMHSSQSNNSVWASVNMWSECIVTDVEIWASYDHWIKIQNGSYI